MVDPQTPKSFVSLEPFVGTSNILLVLDDSSPGIGDRFY